MTNLALLAPDTSAYFQAWVDKKPSKSPRTRKNAAATSPHTLYVLLYGVYQYLPGTHHYYNIINNSYPVAKKHHLVVAVGHVRAFVPGVTARGAGVIVTTTL